MTMVVVSAGEGERPRFSFRGEALLLGANYVSDSFDESGDEDNGVEVESARAMQCDEGGLGYS